VSSAAALGNAPASFSKVAGVPKVRQRDGGHAITNALPMTSLTGTVLVVGSHGPLEASDASGPQWNRESSESLR
jgi:hypothetical protein